MILENAPPLVPQIVGKMPKAHAKGIVNLQFVYNGVQVALCSVGHDSIKLWKLNDMEDDNIVLFTQMNEYSEWRCGVQAVHTLPSASCTGVVGGDSMIYSLEADDDGSHIRPYDMGYMEVWHMVCLEPGRFITTSFSGYLSEVIDGKWGLREPYPKIKSIGCMNLSPSGRLLALGGAEGSVDLVDTLTLKTVHNVEAHSTRITSVLLLSDERLLTGGKDKYIKLYTVSGGTHTLEKTLCGHRGAVSCMVAAPSLGETKRFASSSVNGQVIVWNLDSSTPLTHVEVPHEGSILALAFSPCGQFLVSGGDDKLLAVYRVDNAPLDENAPLLNSGMELREEMEEREERAEMENMNGGKENEEPTQRGQIMSDEEEQMDVDNGAEATTRDLFGDSSDSDDGEKRSEDGDREEGGEGEDGERNEEEEERRESRDGEEREEREMVEEEGGGYEDYGREEEGDEVREEGGGYEEEERPEVEQGEGERQEEEERSEEGEDGGGYIPSRVKKEEPLSQGYGDSPRRDDNPTTTPPYHE